MASTEPLPIESTVPIQKEVTSPPPTPLHQLMRSGVMVKITVGPQKEAWLLHEDVICERSDYFKKAFTGGYMESDKKEIHLAEDDPRAFGYFIDWIYGKSVFCDGSHETPADVTFSHVRQWIDLYIFADKISLVELAHEALEQYKECSEGTLPCTEEIQLIYENTLEQSRLREHVVNALVGDFFGQGPDDFEFYGNAVACNVGFARDIAKAQKCYILQNAKDCQLYTCTIRPKGRRTAGGQVKRLNKPSGEH